MSCLTLTPSIAEKLAHEWLIRLWQWVTRTKARNSRRTILSYQNGDPEMLLFSLPAQLMCDLVLLMQLSSCEPQLGRPSYERCG